MIVAVPGLSPARGMFVDFGPVVELKLELRKFCNVDLHARGYYHIRCKVKASQKYGNSKVDVRVPRSVAPHVFPASVVDGLAVGKTIEIMYAEETVQLDDAFHFTLRIPQRFDKLPLWLNFTIVLELWFCEKEHMLKKSNKDLMDGFRCLSRRDLLLRFSLCHGLHYSRPILFDYYNLAAVTLGIHASLVEFASKPSAAKRVRKTGSSGKISAGSVDAANGPNAGTGSSGSPIPEKVQAYHRNMCRTLLSAYESLQLRTKTYAQYFPSKYQIRIQLVDTAGKLDALCRRLLEEPDPWVAIDQDRQLLSQELGVLWRQFLDLFHFSDEVDRALAAEHHNARVKRLAEGFFHTEDTLPGLVAASFTANGQSLGFYSRLIDILKRSTYFCDLPQLPVASQELDGSSETMPVIFEEKYLAPVSSRKASRMPSQNFSESADQRGRGLSKPEKKLSPDKVVRALKNSLCLDLRHRNRPAEDSLEHNGVGDESEKRAASADSRSEHLVGSSTSTSSLSSPASPLYLSAVGTAAIKKSCSEPNLVLDRERETFEGIPCRSKSEFDVAALTFAPLDDQNSMKEWSESGRNSTEPSPDKTLAERHGFCCLPICTASTNTETKVTDIDGAGISASSSDTFYSAQLTAGIDESVVEFVSWKEHFKERLSLTGYTGHLCSDFVRLASRTPYLSVVPPQSSSSEAKVHLIICVHGLDGCSVDLRPYRTFLRLAMPGECLDFLMSERNQNETFNDFEAMTKNFVDEILVHLSRSLLEPARISFVAHSLGTIIVRSALCDPRLDPFLDRLHCFLSLNGPHCGVLFNQKAVNWGMSFVQWWKRSRSLQQLTLRDKPPESLRESFLYQLSSQSGLALFKYVLLVGSNQDMYVPCHSALIQPCKAAQRDSSHFGRAYNEMVTNLLHPVVNSKRRTTLVRYTAFHGMAGISRTHQVLGRAAHIAVLDDDLFIEKLLNVSALQYFL